MGTSVRLESDSTSTTQLDHPIMKSSILLSSALLALASIITPCALHAQGSLTPPAGPPAPVMKTLDQVEARTPLTAGQTGVSINSTTGSITISQSGSYYLTGNVTVSTVGAHGIVISAPRVTLDLNGFSLRCTTVNGGDGISYGASKGTRIINGIIAGAATQTNGVFSGFGWNRGIVGTGGSTRVTNVIVRSVRGAGIEASPANAALSQVDRCLVDTVGGTGIHTAGSVKDSQALNTGGTAIFLPGESLGVFNSAAMMSCTL